MQEALTEPDAQEEARRLAERQRLQTDAVSGSVWTAIQTVITLPIGMVANIVVAHSLGARAYGTLAIYTLIYTMVVWVLNAGISDATVQWIATHKARAEARDVTEAVRRCSGYYVFVQAPLVAVLMVVLLRNAGVVAMVIGACSAATMMMLATSTVVMSGSALNALAARIALAVGLATQTAVIVVASTSHLPTSVFVARIAASFLGPALALMFVPRDMRAAVLRPRLPRHWPPGFLGYALRTCASGVVTTLVFSRSELLVFQTYGLPKEAGIFALSAGVAALITAPVDSLLNPLLPATAGLLATNPERAAPALLRGLRTSTLLAGLVAAVGIPVLVPLLPLMYGSSFGGAVGPFIALGVISCVQSVNHPVLAFLFAGRRTGLLFKTSLLSLILDMAIAFATIPLIGVAGAVVASSIAQLSVLGITARRVGQMLEAPVSAQLRAMVYFCDALTITALAIGAELLVADASRIVRAVIGLAVALAAVAVGGRLRRSTGLTNGDVDVISLGLPGPLRRVFRGLVRTFAMEAAA